MLKPFLQFIEELSPAAFNHAVGMEQILFQDPGLALVKSRNFLEEIIHSIFELESLSDNEVSNRTLFDQISYLSNEGYLTNQVQFAIHSLRKLGNKGAHGTVELLEEPLKAHRLMYEIAAWYYESYSILQDEKPAYCQPKPHANLEQQIEQQLKRLFGGDIPEKKSLLEEESPVRIEERQSSIELDLDKGESYLIRELKRLQDSSKEAIENANVFSAFKDYLHVERKVQRDLVHLLSGKQSSKESNLVLICGSVGDGKSHLLAYLKSKHPNLVQDYSIINDATESYSPSVNALETLKQSLNGFTNQSIAASGQKTLLAINMGVLHNFIQSDEVGDFSLLKDFIDESGVFSQKRIQYKAGANFDLICIGDYHPYELNANGIQSTFYSELIDKVFGSQLENPFKQAYDEDIKNNIYTATHFNYEFMRDHHVQQSIINLVIECIIKYKIVISARSFLNFIGDIVVVNDRTPYELHDEFYKLDQSVPMLLFNRPERSFILKQMALLNPYTSKRIKEVDQLIINLSAIRDSEEVVLSHILNPKGRELFTVLMKDTELDHEPFLKFAEAVILTAFLTNIEFNKMVHSADPIYESYLWRLYGYNTYHAETVRGIYNEVKDSVFKWRGSPRRDYIYLSDDHTKFRLAQKLELKPSLQHIQSLKQTGTVLESFYDKLVISYKLNETNATADLEIDYSLFQLLTRIKNGYVPNKEDYDDALKFLEFVEKLMSIGMKTKELLIHLETENKLFSLSKDEFYGYVFEKERT